VLERQLLPKELLQGVAAGGDGGLISGGDGPVEGDQDAGARGGWQGRHLRRFGGLAVVAGCIARGSNPERLPLESLSAGRPTCGDRQGSVV
jgi:hypothetical protein